MHSWWSKEETVGEHNNEDGLGQVDQHVTFKLESSPVEIEDDGLAVEEVMAPARGRNVILGSQRGRCWGM